MRPTIANLPRAETLDRRDDPLIGCRILTIPFFWPEEIWLPAPANLAANTVVGRSYSTNEPDGLTLWNEVQDRLNAIPQAPQPIFGSRDGPPTLYATAPGPRCLRLAVTDSYDRRCAVLGEKTLPILDAAHIRSYSDGGAHDVSNGLLLRTNIQRLFDLGYVTVTERGQFAVSEQLKRDLNNGVH